MGKAADLSIPFWAKCPGCQHCWPAAYYPVDLGAIGRVLKGCKCPKGCSNPPVIAKQDNGKLQEPGQKRKSKCPA